uniref:Uncharacterized protein n=1 Tax=Arundo donax TaxID=35708 RepID=A0A0A9E5E6_ARUDO
MFRSRIVGTTTMRWRQNSWDACMPSEVVGYPIVMPIYTNQSVIWHMAISEYSLKELGSSTLLCRFTSQLSLPSCTVAHLINSHKQRFSTY